MTVSRLNSSQYRLGSWHGFHAAAQRRAGFPGFGFLAREKVDPENFFTGPTVTAAKLEVALGRRPEREIVPAIARQRMISFGQGRHAVKVQPRRAAPDDHVAVPHRDSPWTVGAPWPAPQERRRESKRNRDDRPGEVAFVAILMKRKPRAGAIAIHQARLGGKTRKSGRCRRSLRKPGKERRHCRPWLPGLRVDRVVAIARTIGHPAKPPAIGHRD